VITAVSEERTANVVPSARTNDGGCTFLLQEPHGMSSQKTAFFRNGSSCRYVVFYLEFRTMNEIHKLGDCEVEVFWMLRLIWDKFWTLRNNTWNRESAAGMAIGSCWTIGVGFLWRHVPSLLQVAPTGSGAQSASFPMGIGDSFSVGKTTGVWNWPLPPICCKGQDHVSLNTRIPTRFHGVVLTN
jgi:hypothetical protein